MSKLKKISITIFIVLTLGIALSVVSSAQDFKDLPSNLTVDNVTAGDTAGFNRAYVRNHKGADGKKDFLCIVSGKNFAEGIKKYTAKAKVDIVGNDATDTNGKTIHDTSNGTLAYLLSKADGKGSFVDVDADRDIAQYYVWYYISTWVKAVGKQFGIYTGMTNTPIKRGTKAQQAEVSKIVPEAIAYAENLDANKLENESVKSKIKVDTIESDGNDYLKVGPFKYKFNGNLSNIEVSDKEDHKVTVTMFGVSGEDGKLKITNNIKDIKTEKEFFIILPSDVELESINKITVKDTYSVKTATVVFWECQVNNKSTTNRQNVLQFKAGEEPKSDSDDWDDIDIELLGNLQITKKDFDDSKNLSEVTLKVQCKRDGKYVKQDSDNKISYVDEADATLFKTDENGEIKIEKLLTGEYVITEISNPAKTYGGETGEVDPNYIYYNTSEESDKTKVDENGIVVKVTTNPNGTYTTLFIYNQKRFIDISGFVWEENAEGKDNSFENCAADLYAEGDVLLEEITVRLLDQDGNIVKNNAGEECITTTDAEGKYKFTGLEIEKLANYYVEFEYDGLTYTTVTPLKEMAVDEYNSSFKPEISDIQEVNSKASEDTEKRKTLNSLFAEITNDTTEDRNKGFSRDIEGNATGIITYDLQYDYYAAYESYEDANNLLITGDTNIAGYSIGNEYANENYVVNEDGSIEIKYINMGVRRREQPDISIVNDLSKVELQINGYGQTYTGNYDPDSNEDVQYGTYSSEKIKNSGNVKVKFGDKYTPYYRDVYLSDIKYSADHQDDDKKLKIYAVYTVTIQNYSNTLTMAVPEIVNYYDKNYEIINEAADYPLGALYGVRLVKTIAEDETESEINKVVNNAITFEGETSGFNKARIKLSDSIENAPRIAAHESLEVELTYKVSDAAVLDLLNGNKTFRNVTEVSAYSTYYSEAIEGCEVGDIYAGIDHTSAPENAIPTNSLDDEENLKTYEDDTDSAPNFILRVKGVRQLEGTVFEDYTGSEEVNTGNIRQGDGKYDETSEGTVGGVTVELLSINDGEWSTAIHYPYTVDEEGTPSYFDTEGQAAIIDETGNDGHFIFEGIEPDEYYIKFTYKNGVTKIYRLNDNNAIDVTVQDYKSTRITSSTMKEAFTNSESIDNDDTIENKEAAYRDFTWYDANEDRYSDAKDDRDQRNAIDNEVKKMNPSTVENLTEKSLSANTPKFSIPIEYNSTVTDSNDNKFIHKISNIDFGIAERAKQEVDLDKIISRIKVTLQNGQSFEQSFEDNTIDEYENFTVIRDPETRRIQNIYITLDSELIYGAHIEIDYKFIVKNNSEVDYVDGESIYDDYYYYGIEPETKEEKDEKVVKLTSTKIVDYVDREIVLKEGQEQTWNVVNDLVAEGLNWNLSEDEIKELLDNFNTVVIAEPITKDNAIAPGASDSTKISVERILANSDELVYNNNGEVVTISKTGGSSITTELGNYEEELLSTITNTPEGIGDGDDGEYSPETTETLGNYVLEIDEAKAATVAVVPPTGSTDNTITYAIIGSISLAIVGAGIFGVKRFLKK